MTVAEVAVRIILEDYIKDVEMVIQCVAPRVADFCDFIYILMFVATVTVCKTREL